MTSQPHGPTGHTQGEIGTAWSTPPGGPHRPAPAVRDSFATGGVAFAGVLLLCGGLLAVLQGVAALAEDDVYARLGTYVYELNLTGWGWIHLVLGILAAATGAGLLKDLRGARPTGILLAGLGLVAQFLFLPYQPLWSVTVMAIDIFVIQSLAAEPRFAAPQDSRG